MVRPLPPGDIKDRRATGNGTGVREPQAQTCLTGQFDTVSDTARPSHALKFWDRAHAESSQPRSHVPPMWAQAAPANLPGNPAVDRGGSGHGRSGGVSPVPDLSRKQLGIARTCKPQGSRRRPEVTASFGDWGGEPRDCRPDRSLSNLKR